MMLTSRYNNSNIIFIGTMESYIDKTKALQMQIKNLHEISMYKSSMTNTFRDRDCGAAGKINLSNFNNVIFVNEQDMYADLEGSTTFETFVNETLPKSLMPAVVPELKTITVGGAIVGLGIESSSFKYGLVHDNILEVDVILSNGDILTCSKMLEPDLFNALPNSLGSLCYIIRARMRLVPVKKYVRIRKYRYTSYTELCKAMTKLCMENRQDNSEIDFVDGVLFSENQGVIVSGTMTDDIGIASPSNYKTDGIYYKSLLPEFSGDVDYLTISDYIWRWDYDWFWCNTSLPFIENYYVRKYMLGEKYLRSDVYKWLFHKLGWLFDYLGYTTGKESVVQDVVIPHENVVKYLEFLYKNILTGSNTCHYVWLCPHYNYSRTLVPSMDDKLYIDVAQWGLFETNSNDSWHLNKLIEKACSDLNGFKGLYSTVHYDKETFDEKYNGKEYKILKSKYDPYNKIRDMYDKCKTKEKFEN
jgi:FAD/FMN-containing dehydrogenase